MLHEGLQRTHTSTHSCLKRPHGADHGSYSQLGLFLLLPPWRSQRQPRKLGKEVRVLGGETRAHPWLFTKACLKQPESGGKGPFSTLGGWLSPCTGLRLLQGGLEVIKWIYFSPKRCQKCHEPWSLFYQKGWEGVNQSHRTVAKNTYGISKKTNH